MNLAKSKIISYVISTTYIKTTICSFKIDLGEQLVLLITKLQIWTTNAYYIAIHTLQNVNWCFLHCNFDENSYFPPQKVQFNFWIMQYLSCQCQSTFWIGIHSLLFRSSISYLLPQPPSSVNIITIHYNLSVSLMTICPRQFQNKSNIFPLLWTSGHVWSVY